MSTNQRLSDAWTALDRNNTSTVVPLIDLLDELAKTLAREESFRVQVGTSVPPLWPILQEIWALAAIPTPDGDSNIRNLRLSVARFTRNLVAAVPYNQQQALSAQIPSTTCRIRRC
ncbi:hypothetical protein QCA50_009151 [Cerrena zonata]|uniref:Uncharacterized protein n=1 Tax=Cerrena zonata TaxID=2478898 RepID=A0AAW0G8R8_9APHY